MLLIMKTVITIVVIALVLVGVYFGFIKKDVQPPISNEPVSTTETADWQTYSNTEYGFEFKYPSSFTQDQWGGDNEPLVYLKTTSGSHLTISLENKIADFKDINFLMDKVEKPKMVIDGKDAYRYSAGDGGCVAELTFINLENKTLKVNFSSCEPSILPSVSLQEEILFTFKFTK